MSLEQNADAKDTNHSDSRMCLPEEVWEKMYKDLIAYRFGHIGFLDLLDKWEELLGIKPLASDIISNQRCIPELPDSEKQE